MRNRELFYRVAAHIEDHPGLYDQKTWRWHTVTGCGTAHCIAGTAVAMAWGEKAWPGEQSDRVIDPATGSLVLVWRAAQRLLGLGDDEADVLFDMDWEPIDGRTVPEALRLIGDGAPVEDVTEREMMDQ